MQIHHSPVMVDEVLGSLAPKTGKKFIDCTMGESGHSEEMLKMGAEVLGIDLDTEAIEVSRRRLHEYGSQVKFAHGNFSELVSIATDQGFLYADGILFDLGFSSLQIETSTRGFSINRNARLDMRFDPNQGMTAHEIINSYEEQRLSRLIYSFGEERSARKIAHSIVASRPINTTTELADVVLRAVGRRPKSKIHPATKTFQAIRIAVNQELENLKSALDAAVRVLAVAGRLAIISYHSLEDRIVKQFFKLESTECICPPVIPSCICNHTARLSLIKRKLTRPSATELNDNPRSRSARLRLAEKI
ncbi:MAG: 16S rRNA (cytosine(1402)-N(4))-methyltransferase RsmH [Chloroflexota bacterium]|nr:16S rRNA (cytosine(1402)-N(4))-methyltransferase RsmH [Chloroflexota bacterium]